MLTLNLILILILNTLNLLSSTSIYVFLTAIKFGGRSCSFWRMQIKAAALLEGRVSQPGPNPNSNSNSNPNPKIETLAAR